MATKKDVIDTGLVEFELPFDRGMEKIYFNPNDVDFFIRMADMIESISGIYDDLTERYDKAEDNLDKLKIIRNLNQEIKDAFDIAFGNNVADVIFKYVSPNGIVKSKQQYYPFYFLEWIMPKIEEETGNTSKTVMSALEKANNKHTAKYQHKITR
jgi:hypothetical protein